MFAYKLTENNNKAIRCYYQYNIFMKNNDENSEEDGIAFHICKSLYCSA